MKNTKVLKKISFIILIIAFLCFYGFSVKYVCEGGKKLGILTESLKTFVSFPKTIKQVLISDEIRGKTPTYIDKDLDFKSINKLIYDVYALNSFFNPEKLQWDIELVNLKNDSICHQWFLSKDSFSSKYRRFNRAMPYNSILLPNRSLIAYNFESNNIYKIDKNSKILWHNTSANYHHSMNLGVDSNIWICSSAPRGYSMPDDNMEYKYFRDDFITKIDIKNGKTLYNKSVSEILISNGYIDYVYGFETHMDHFTHCPDPIHLNDIEPVLYDGDYWKKGDVFLSLRHKSLIIHFRPETNQIVHLIEGPFLNQHDVDIYSDHEISVFNNNSTLIKGMDLSDYIGIIDSSLIKIDHIKTSQIVIYDFETKTYRRHMDSVFIEENIFTQSEGLHHLLSNGDVYVENHNKGKVYIMNKNGVVMRRQFDSPIEDKVHLPHWIRIYENINF